MFDPKQLLDALTRSAAQPAAATPGQGGLGDLLGQILGGGQTPDPRTRNLAPDEQARAPGGLGGVLGNRQQAPDANRPQAPGNLGGLADVLGNIFGQATQGVKEGAGRINDATGAGTKIDDLLRQLTGGQASGDLVAKLKDVIANNPMAAGAILGGLGTLLGGTRTGRSLAFDAAKVGGLVLIGGLAYKAWQNHQAGKPLITGREATPDRLALAAPDGSGFEETAQSDESALLYVRAMIAAATADGEVDADELQRITGNLRQIGFDDGARAFLEQEFANPASIDELAAGARSPEVASQVYAAARIAIEPDSAAERAWLAALGEALGLEPDLIAQLDAVATGVKA